MNNVFLYANVEEEIYMALPQGLSTSKPKQVCLLNKCLYGLKQASWQRFTTISHAL